MAFGFRVGLGATLTAVARDSQPRLISRSVLELSRTLTTQSSFKTSFLPLHRPLCSFQSHRLQTQLPATASNNRIHSRTRSYSSNSASVPAFESSAHSNDNGRGWRHRFNGRKTNSRHSKPTIMILGLGFSALALLQLSSSPVFASAPTIDSGRSPESLDEIANSEPFLIVAPSSNESEKQSQRFSPLIFLRERIVEPFLTLIRFLRLAILFVPVIVTSPMLLIGSSSGRVRENGVWKRNTGPKESAKERRKRRKRRSEHDGLHAKGEIVKESRAIGGEEERWGAVWWYSFLVKQMERAGPTFIKLGQWAASRADLFPAALCDMMGKLHSNGNPHAFPHTKKVLEEVFGRRLDELFEEFAEEPIGCGAIAQVYKATMKSEFLPENFLQAQEANANANVSVGVEAGDTTAPHSQPIPNTAVAIKVLHPRVEKMIRRDLAIMRIFARCINVLPGMQWLSLPDEVDVFGDMMNSQLDLRVEANNLDRFQENFKHRGPAVTFPRPVRVDEDRTSHNGNGNGNGKSNGNATGNNPAHESDPRVLIEEYEEALPLKYFLQNGGGLYDDRLANIGLDAFLNMLLLDNWTHGDLHPGNIMVRFYKPTTSDFLQHLASKMFSTPEPADPIFSNESTRIVEELKSVAHDPNAWRTKLDELAEKGYEPELIFIDAGLVTSLDTANRRNFLDLFQAVAEFDGYRAGELMVERCRTPELVIDKETFALKMQHLVLSVKSKTFSLAAIKISDILTEVLQAVRQHHVKMEGDFVNTVISILLLEGIGRQLDPNMDLFKSALPILRQLGRKMSTTDAISQVPKGNILAMAKIWIYLEAREIAGSASSIDEWIKFDRLSPNI